MRKVAIALCYSLSLTCSAVADDDTWTGKRGFVAAFGQPICTDRSELQDFFLASAAADEDWLSQLDSCSTFHEALSVKVLRTYPGSDVLKVRAYVGAGSIVGYTISSALIAR